jgi:hypothetical protein
MNKNDPNYKTEECQSDEHGGIGLYCVLP